MENFVPVSAIVGGGLIGLSAAVPWVANGRIAGISGIVGGMLAPLSADFAWRSAFVASLMVAPMSYRFAGAPLTDLNSEGAAIAALALGAPKSVAFVGACWRAWPCSRFSTFARRHAEEPDRGAG